MKQIDILEITESWYELLKDYFDSDHFKATMKTLKEELIWQPEITKELADDCDQFIEERDDEKWAHKFDNIDDYNDFIEEHMYDPKYFYNYDSRTTPGSQIYPYYKDIFNAYNLCSFEKVKVIILGQNPYHGKRQAHGLAFSVQEGQPIPKSLHNIFQELDSDLAKSIPENGDLTRWAEQGIFLLNTSLTVREGQSTSHLDIGWQILTQATIQRLSQHSEPGLVFLLWGKDAQSFESLIDEHKHYILKAAHPSPFSAYTGFFGCKHFSKTNQILESQNKQIINW